MVEDNRLGGGQTRAAGGQLTRGTGGRKTMQEPANGDSKVRNESESSTGAYRRSVPGRKKEKELDESYLSVARQADVANSCGAPQAIVGTQRGQSQLLQRKGVARTRAEVLERA